MNSRQVIAKYGYNTCLRALAASARLSPDGDGMDVTASFNISRRWLHDATYDQKFDYPFDEDAIKAIDNRYRLLSRFDGLP
jgi:hypothetical protein